MRTKITFTRYVFQMFATIGILRHISFTASASGSSLELELQCGCIFKRLQSTGPDLCRHSRGLRSSQFRVGLTVSKVLDSRASGCIETHKLSVERHQLTLSNCRTPGLSEACPDLYLHTQRPVDNILPLSRPRVQVHACSLIPRLT